MSKITIMSKQTAELIAAGEVVERPSSVIKELVENCIDAGATSVTVEIENGGTTLMRVTDNGCGIERDDVAAAFLSHATSKLRQADDLQSIGTLGFRGEALASIAAVSRTELITKTAADEVGTRLEISGGEFGDVTEYGCPNGTTVIVRDLFYNTPARMKFLKKDVREGNACAEVIDREALAHPEISFKLIRDGKQALLTPGNGRLIDCIHAVLGKDIARQTVPVDYSFNGVSVSGAAGLPQAGRANHSMQFFFVNGRFVNTRTCTAAVDQAYKNSIMAGRFPICVLNIKMPFDMVDVNVHPAKIEVRFVSEKSVFDAVYYGVKSALKQEDKRPEAAFTDPFERRTAAVGQRFVNEVLQTRPQREAEPKQAPASEKSGAGEGYSIMYAKQAIGEAEEERPISVGSPALRYSSAVPAVPPQSEPVPEIRSARSPSIDIVYDEPPQPHYRENVPPPRNAQTVGGEESEILEETRPTGDELPDVRVLGEAFKTYIVAEAGDEIYIIDKHAAHERMLFERLKRRDRGAAQLLLSPVTLELAADEYDILLANADLLDDAGFAVEDFGGKTVIVRQVPMELCSEDIGAVMSEIAARLKNHNTDISTEKLDWIYESVACRAAVKAGDSTNQRELAILAVRVLKDDVRYCPHGRPVAVTMTRKQLEKQFGRSI